MWNFCNVKSQRLFSGTLRSGWKIWRFLLAVLIALEHTSLLSDLCLPLEMLRNNGDLPKRGFREQQTQIRGLSHEFRGSESGATSSSHSPGLQVSNLEKTCIPGHSSSVGFSAPPGESCTGVLQALKLYSEWRMFSLSAGTFHGCSESFALPPQPCRMLCRCKARRAGLSFTHFSVTICNALYLSCFAFAVRIRNGAEEVSRQCCLAALSVWVIRQQM